MSGEATIGRASKASGGEVVRLADHLGAVVAGGAGCLRDRHFVDVPARGTGYRAELLGLTRLPVEDDFERDSALLTLVMVFAGPRGRRRSSFVSAWRLWCPRC